MSEVRYNNQGGNLGAALTASTTTITFSTAPNFATLSGGEYIKLVLDYGTSSFEIVYLTAYTATSTTGTITRAAEDSANWPATSHSSGTGTWSCNPTVDDFTGGGPSYQSGAGEPTSVTPASVGQLYIDTTNGGTYVGIATSSGAWVQLGGYAPSYAWPGVDAAGSADGGPFAELGSDADNYIYVAPSGMELWLDSLPIINAVDDLWERYVPISTAPAASISPVTISSGVAFQPNVGGDVELCFDITLAGTLSFTMGPTTGTENTIINARAVVAGTVVSKRIPAAWHVVITLTTATIGDATIQVV